MTLTLHRSRWLLYHGSYAAVDTHEWSFAPIVPTRSVVEAGEGRRRCVQVREPDGSVVVDTPKLARLVEIDIHDGKDDAGKPKVVGTTTCLAFHGETGIGPESVVYLATRGERGFTMAKRVEQPSLFGDDEPKSVGAYGRRPAREDRVAPVAAELAKHAATNDTPPWMPPSAALDPIRPAVAEGLKALADELSRPEPSAIDAAKDACSGLAQTLGKLTEAQAVAAARLRAIDEDDAAARERLKVVREILNPPTSTPNRVPQHDVDQAGVDLVVDVARAIAHIERGSGATAIAILRRVEAVLAKEVKA